MTGEKQREQGRGRAPRDTWKGKDNERKKDLEILESPLAEKARRNQVKTRLIQW